MFKEIMNVDTKLIWLDMEMSGLEVKSNVILQIAIIITDSSLNELHPGVNFVVRHPKQIFEKMDEWNTKQHKASGLIKKCLKSPLELEEVEQLCTEYVLKYTTKRKSPLCGNTILQDRRFLYEYMPDFSDNVHYRSLDISSFKIVKEVLFPSIDSFQKSFKHDALIDIRETISEFHYYKNNLFVKNQ